MGSCQSHKINPSDNIATAEQKALSAKIEEDLMKEKNEEKSAIKVLLLGTSDSGKSTVLKQMRILHLNGFSDTDRKGFRPHVLANTLTCMQSLLRACAQMEIPLDSPKNTEKCTKLLGLPAMRVQLEIRDDLLELWKDSGVQAAFRRKSEFALLDSANYFLSAISRTFSSDYVPLDMDVLRIRQPTTGVTQTDFVMDDVKFQMFDVGGQRGERKKWIHYFEDVTAILYIAAMSDYDQVGLEDRSKNRLGDSLELFSAIINLPWFRKAHVILFLNKNDVFVEKIAQVDLGIYFPSYTGGCNYKSALEYIQMAFFDRVEDANKNVYCHVTDATNTENIKFVWRSTKHMILETQLTGAGLQMC